MAKRINRPNHTDSCREKIQTSQLLNRLHNHVLTHEEDPEFKKKNLTPSQVKGIEILLNKTLPNLASTELKHEGEITLGSLLAGMDEPETNSSS